MSNEAFHVRMMGQHAVRKPVAKMTLADVLLSVAWHEKELQLTEIAAQPHLAMLRQAATGDRHAIITAELRDAQAMAKTLLKVQRQVGRLRRAVQALSLPLCR
jgi:hypothetical protein